MIPGVVAAQGRYEALVQLWTPGEITTQLWFDAADSSTITLVSGAVSQWNDKSGNNRHASQGTASNRPVYSGGLVVFDGSNDSVGNGSPGSLLRNVGGATISGVFKFTSSPTSTQQIIAICSSDTSILKSALEGGFVSEKISIGGRRLNTDSFIRINDPNNIDTNLHIAIGVFDYSNALFSLYVDGFTSVSPTDFHVSGNTPDVDAVRFRIGATGVTAGSAWFNGGLGESVVTHTAMDTTARQILEGYYAHKWALTANLPSDHPYKSAPPIVE